MVAMPTSVLTHIDNVVTEMERELHEIRAFEQRQEASDLRQGQLDEIRRLVAERLLIGGNDEDDLRNAKAEVNRLGALEADHMALKTQVSELELQRSSAEREREELVRVRAALELECETRLNELKAAAEALEGEKRRAVKIEESANERVIAAAYEAEAVQKQLLEAEVTLERERMLNGEALASNESTVVALKRAESDLEALEGNSRAVLNDCRSLQAKIKDMEEERSLTTVRIRELDIENAELRASDEENRLRMLELLKEIEDHKGQHEHHHHHMKIHIEKIQGFESDAAAGAIKVSDLEKSLADRDVQLQGHHRQHSLNNQKITDLESFVQELQGNVLQSQQTSGQHRSRISELEALVQSYKGKHSDAEQRLKEYEDAHDGHKRQHQANKLKIQELEDALLMHQGTRSRSESSHMSKAAQLEQQLLELQAAHDGHARQNKSHQMKISELERELEENRLAIEGHHRTHTTNRGKLSEMEQRLAEYEANHDKNLRKHSLSSSKIGNLESDLERLQDEKARAEKLHGTHKSRIQELEELLEASHREHGEKHAKNGARLKEYEQMLADTQAGHDVKHGQNDRRIKELMQQLEDSQAALAASRKECELLKIDIENTVEKHNQYLKIKTDELQLKLAQANETISSLRLQLDQATTKSVSLERQSSFSRKSVASSFDKRQTLVGELIQRDYLVGRLLPDSTDSFVAKVQQATVNIGDALKSANEAHVKCIHAQLTSLREGRNIGTSVKDALFEFAEKEIINSERSAAAELVEASLSEMRALEMELPTVHNLSDYEKNEVIARIQLDLAKCEEELELLRLDTALEDVPETVLLMILMFQDEGPSANWEDGFSPMHWAAKYARRDILEYMLRLPEGRSLLQKRDIYGRAPLYYAQASKTETLSHWLQREVEGGDAAPIEVIGGRPDDAIATLPPQYAKVLKTIERHGWSSMKWKDGFTMLHWAAGKGNRDICRYLMEIGGDANAVDRNNRTPLDIATDRGDTEILAVLTSKRKKSIFPRSRPSTSSGMNR